MPWESFAPGKFAPAEEHQRRRDRVLRAYVRTKGKKPESKEKKRKLNGALPRRDRGHRSNVFFLKAARTDEKKKTNEKRSSHSLDSGKEEKKARL